MSEKHVGIGDKVKGWLSSRRKSSMARADAGQKTGHADQPAAALAPAAGTHIYIYISVNPRYCSQQRYRGGVYHGPSSHLRML